MQYSHRKAIPTQHFFNDAVLNLDINSNEQTRNTSKAAGTGSLSNKYLYSLIVLTMISLKLISFYPLKLGSNSECKDSEERRSNKSKKKYQQKKGRWLCHLCNLCLWYKGISTPCYHWRDRKRHESRHCKIYEMIKYV